ncbi:MAG: FMN-binding negative transcriptional regulator [Terracidiphilus sp.]|jgi:transcriptional regulator
MFVRDCWKPGSETEIFSLIEQNSWGLLVSNGSSTEPGLPSPPYATNLAFVLSRERRVLTSHIARANSHAAALLRDKSPSLAIFEGPSSYVSASWYPGRDMPPTIYYTAVHCYGTLTFQDEGELRDAIEELTQLNEAGVPNGWQTSEIPEKDITRRLPAILGFEFRIDRLEAKFKLGQDEPKRDALAVAERLLASSNPRDRILGEMTRGYNENRS